MATIMCLPNEVIEIILGYNNLRTEDIINFKCVWEQFPSTAKYDIDWERIFSQRWPSAKKHYDKQSKENEQKDSEENEQKDKKSSNFIETGINCARQLRDYVYQIINKYYYNNGSLYNCTRALFYESVKHEAFLDNNFKKGFDEIIKKPENFVEYSFFIDEMKNLLTQFSRRTGCVLTERYCIMKLFYYMRQRSVIMKWDRFEKQPDREQLNERIATIVAQSIQPQKDVFYSCVKASLDSIAQQVLNCLRKKHPDHSIFSTSAETFSYWKNYNIDDNHWNEAEGTQIMDTLDEYLFGTLNFRSSRVTNSKYMCIDNVLENKYGHEIILFIIYHSVARRLGLRCDVIFSDSSDFNRLNYCILWKPEYARKCWENVRCFNISCKEFPDCFVNQLSIRVKLWHSIAEHILKKAARGMMGKMKRQLPDLGIVYNGVVIKSNFNFFDRSIHIDINCKYWNCFQKGEKFITRPEDVKYAVGMIVTHSDQITDNVAILETYDDQTTDSCAGVIVGWYRHVEFSEARKDAVTCIDICELPWNHYYSSFLFKPRQTYYTILTEKNKMCFVEEDVITLTTPKWIDNIEIGRYFCKFEGTHYVPNKMLARLYPQDAAITAQTRSEN